MSPAINTIATEQLPFHTLAKARRVYMQRMRRSLKMLTGSLAVVATVFTVAALSLATVVKIGCTAFLVIAIYVIVVRSKLRRATARRGRDSLSNSYCMISHKNRWSAFSGWATLAGGCVALFLVFSTLLNQSSLDLVESPPASVESPPASVESLPSSPTSAEGNSPSGPIAGGPTPSSYDPPAVESTGVNDGSNSTNSEKIIARSIVGTWLSDDGRYSIDIEYGDGNNLLLHFKDEETGAAQSVEIENKADLDSGKILSFDNSMGHSTLIVFSSADGRPLIELYVSESSDPIRLDQATTILE